MLSPEERQSARRFADHCSAMLKDDERDQSLQRAYDMIDMLRDRFGDDETSFKVARYMALVMIAIGSTPAVQLGDLLDGSVASYSFAAGKLAGVYELPERKTAPEPQGGTQAEGIPFPIHERSDGSQSSDTGMYL